MCSRGYVRSSLRDNPATDRRDHRGGGDRRDGQRSEVRFEARGGVLYVTNAEPDPAPFSVARSGPKPKVPYDDLIRLAATRYGLPVELLESVIRVESNFEPRALSAKGARGLMQLMPETARLLGVADVFDVAQNIDGGARHLRNLVDRYGGNYS